MRRYEKTGRLRSVRPDRELARGLLRAAQEDIVALQSIRITTKNASLVFKGAYDCPRSLFEAVLAQGGWSASTHEAILQHARAELPLTKKQSWALDRHRKLRNDIVYRGRRATRYEAEQLLLLAEGVLPLVQEELGH